MTRFRSFRQAMAIVLCLILSVCVAVSANETDATSAQTHALSGQCGDTAYYEFDGTTLTISGTGAIWDGAEYTCQWSYAQFIGMKHIVIQEGITAIGKDAFKNVGTTACTISLPNSLTKIGEGAFVMSGVTDVVLPNGVTSVPSNAFAYSSIRSIAMPGVTEVGKQAFAGCSGLTSVTFSESLKSIGQEAFQNCGFIQIELPIGVTMIGSNAFNACGNLKTIIVKNPECKIDFTGSGALGVPGKTTVKGCTKTDAENYAKQNGYTFVSIDCEMGLHAYSGIVTAPTCTEQGYTTYQCKNCKANYTDSFVESTGHKYTEKVTPPTLTNQGYTTHTCMICGDSYKDSFVPPHTHTYEDTVVDPTCTKEGYTVHYCPECGYSYEDCQTEPTGHIWGEWVTDSNKNWERSCQICLATEQGKGEYIITSGQGSWQEGSDKPYTLYVDADLKALLSVSVDGVKLSGSAFDITDDMTGVKLTAAYLRTLAPGEHTVKLTFTDGVGETTLTVEAKEPDSTQQTTDATQNTQTTPSSPQQNDDTPSGPPIILWVVLGVILLAAIAVGLYFFFERFGNPFAN